MVLRAAVRPRFLASVRCAEHEIGSGPVASNAMNATTKASEGPQSYRPEAFGTATTRP
jgi:hypothetical protein